MRLYAYPDIAALIGTSLRSVCIFAYPDIATGKWLFTPTGIGVFLAGHRKGFVRWREKK